MSIIKNKIEKYFKKNFPLFKYTKSTKIFDYIDSIGMYDFVIYLEKNFKIKILDKELVNENFENFESLEKLIEKKINKK